MLILSRVPGEKIVLTHEPTGETVTLVFTKNQGRRAYLGFNAGRNFSIVRAEVLGDDFQERILEPRQQLSPHPKKEESDASHESPAFYPYPIKPSSTRT